MTDAVLAATAEDDYLAEIYAMLLAGYNIDFYTEDEKGRGLFGLEIVTGVRFYVARPDLKKALSAFEEAYAIYFDEIDDMDDDWEDIF